MEMDLEILAERKRLLLDRMIASVMEAFVVEATLVSVRSLMWISLTRLMMIDHPKEVENVNGRETLALLSRSAPRSVPDNRDDGETDEDEDEDDDDDEHADGQGDDNDDTLSGEGEDADDDGDDEEVNGEDSDDPEGDDDDEEDEDEEEDEEDEEEDEDEEEEEETEAAQPPSKKRK